MSYDLKVHAGISNAKTVAKSDTVKGRSNETPKSGRRKEQRNIAEKELKPPEGKDWF